MSVSHHIGLEIAERAFRFVEIQQQDRHTTVLRAEIFPTSHDYASSLFFDLPYRQELARDFIRDLAGVVLRQDVYAQDLSIVLPSLLPLVTMLPTDPALSALQQRDLLQWDCSTLHGSAPGDRLSIQSHVLEQAGRTLAMALPESCVEFLNQVCEHLTLGLAAIDADHFVMENIVRHQYPHEAQGRFAVLGLFPGHCSAGVYGAGAYQGFRQTAITFKRHYAAQAVHLLESLPGFHQGGHPVHVFLFGSAAGDDVLDAMADILPGTVARAVPLADSDFAPGLTEVLRDAGERQFDVAAAAAILGAA